MTSINFISHWFDSTGIWTHDPLHARQVLYQFSHCVRYHTHGDLVSAAPVGDKAAGTMIKISHANTLSWYCANQSLSYPTLPYARYLFYKSLWLVWDSNSRPSQPSTPRGVCVYQFGHHTRSCSATLTTTYPGMWSEVPAAGRPWTRHAASWVQLVKH